MEGQQQTLFLLPGGYYTSVSADKENVVRKSRQRSSFRAYTKQGLEMSLKFHRQKEAKFASGKPDSV